MKSLFFIFFLFVIIENCHAQFIVNKNSYTLELGPDQSYQSVFVKYDEKREDLYRTVKRPKAADEIFNLKTGKLKNKITPQLENINSIAIIRDSSFWTFEDMKREFVHFDLAGNIIERIKEMQPIDKNGLPSYFSDFGVNPLILFKNNLYLVGAFMQYKKLDYNSLNYKNHGVIRNLDLINNNLSWKGHLPLSTRENNYGYMNRYSMVQNGNKLIVSPIFSDEIQVYDLLTNKTYFPKMEANKYSKLIKPFSPISNRDIWEGDSLNSHFVKSYKFTAILYDKYRDVYYRFLIRPANDFNDPTYSILILDKAFKMIGDYDLPEKYLVVGAFVSKKGLNMVDYDSYEQDDSKLVYHSFLLK